MPKAIISQLAKRDLDDIWVYIARRNVPAAEKLDRRLRAIFRNLAMMPGLGPAREDVAPGVRSFPEGNYLVLYRVISGGVEILRVWHGARGLGGAIDTKDSNVDN